MSGAQSESIAKTPRNTHPAMATRFLKNLRIPFFQSDEPFGIFDKFKISRSLHIII